MFGHRKILEGFLAQLALSPQDVAAGVTSPYVHAGMYRQVGAFAVGGNIANGTNISLQFFAASDDAGTGAVAVGSAVVTTVASGGSGLVSHEIHNSALPQGKPYVAVKADSSDAAADVSVLWLFGRARQGVV